MSEIKKIQSPRLGYTVTHITLLRFPFKEGDFVLQGDSIIEFSSKYINAGIPSPVTGVIRKLYFKEGETVGVEEVLADIEPQANPALEAGFELGII